MQSFIYLVRPGAGPAPELSQRGCRPSFLGCAGPKVLFPDGEGEVCGVGRGGLWEWKDGGDGMDL